MLYPLWARCCWLWLWLFVPQETAMKIIKLLPIEWIYNSIFLHKCSENCFREHIFRFDRYPDSSNKFYWNLPSNERTPCIYLTNVFTNDANMFALNTAFGHMRYIVWLWKDWLIRSFPILIINNKTIQGNIEFFPSENVFKDLWTLWWKLKGLSWKKYLQSHPAIYKT